MSLAKQMLVYFAELLAKGNNNTVDAEFLPPLMTINELHALYLEDELFLKGHSTITSNDVASMLQKSTNSVGPQIQ